MDIDKNYHGFLKFQLEYIRSDGKNLEIIFKIEKIDFLAKFAWKLKFHGNRGKFVLTQFF